MSSCRATNAKAFLPDGVNVPACPSCGAWGNRAGGGVHDRTCALAAALREPDAVAVEREACAAIVERWLREGYDLDELALAIRERGGSR